MKSIIQEASSIEKAIKQSWERAEKPTEFTIKVLEESEKNFLGFTKKPAKIAIFFEEKIQTKRKKVTTKPKQLQEKKQPVSIRKKEESLATKKYPQKMEIKEKIEKEMWSKELVDTATKWTEGILKYMEVPHIKFATIAKQKNLRFNFYSPLLKDEKKQMLLFKNLSFLLMQTLRYKFKRAFRNLNVTFTCK